MSKRLRIDSVGGASGDMFLGVVHDLGVSLESITEALQSLPIDPFFLTSETVNERGITAKRVTVHVGEEDGTHHDHHHHRHLPDIEKIIDGGDLPQPVRDMARNVFHRLADAEASVHGIPREKVHFHEVGAMDSIIDIIGSCWALHHLGVEAVECASLPVGQGSFTCAHGTYPLPAPATLALLQGFNMVTTDEPFELVTPTGAALITSWLSASPSAGGAVEKIGYGAGHRELSNRPNVMRATLIAVEGESVGVQDEVIMLACNVDDATGESLGGLMDALFEVGALDVQYVPCYMKKNRPGVEIQVLCKPESQSEIESLLFEETMTLGVRSTSVSRTILPRSVQEVQTPYGLIQMKVAELPGGRTKAKPEWADCEQRAKESGCRVRDVYQTALRAFHEKRSS